MSLPRSLLESDDLTKWNDEQRLVFLGNLPDMDVSSEALLHWRRYVLKVLTA